MAVKDHNYSWPFIPFSLPFKPIHLAQQKYKYSWNCYSLIKTATAQQTKLTEELQTFPLEMEAGERVKSGQTLTAGKYSNFLYFRICTERDQMLFHFTASI